VARIAGLGPLLRGRGPREFNAALWVSSSIAALCTAQAETPHALGNSVACCEQEWIRQLDVSLGVLVCVQVYVAKKLDDCKFYAIKKARQQFKGTGDRRAPRARSLFPCPGSLRYR
jgi:hypothetical protein